MLVPAAFVAAACLVVAGARLFGGPAPLPQLAAFAPWLVPGWLVVLGLLVAGRLWWPVTAVLVLFAVAVLWVVPPSPPSIEDGAGAARLRVMTANVLAGRADADAIVRAARAEGVDLLAVQEALPELADHLSAGLRDQLPYVAGSDPEGGTGTRIWSRRPIEPVGVPFGEGHQIFQVRLGSVLVTVVHTMSPGPGRIPGWHRDLAALTEASRRASGPQVMLGDFNATRDHRPFRRLLGTGLVDSADVLRAPPWRGLTWPADRPFPPLLRLDHVLVTPETIRARALRTLRIPGTDHRAVLVDVEIMGRSGVRAVDR